MMSASFPMHWQNKSMVLALVCRWASLEILFGNLVLKSTELLILSGWLQKSTGAQPVVPAHFLNTWEHCMDSIATVFSIASNSKKDIARRFWLFQNTSATESWASGSLGCPSEKEEGKGDGRSVVHIKAYLWSIEGHPSTLHSLSCFLQNSEWRFWWCWAFYKIHDIPGHGSAALSRSPPKSENCAVNGACCLPRILLGLAWAPLLFLVQLYRRETKPTKRSTTRQQKILIPVLWETHVLASLSKMKTIPALSSCSLGDQHCIFNRICM
jgi:hypothetical protein